MAVTRIVPVGSGLQKEAEVLYYPDPQGWIPDSPGGAFGLYFLDMRHLSCLDLTLGGERPVADGPLLKAGGATLRWETVVTAGRLFGRLRVHGAGQVSEIRLTLEADLRDVFEVRGVYPPGSPGTHPPRWLGGCCLFRRKGRDGVLRRTMVRLSPSPDRCVSDGPRAHAYYRLEGPLEIELSARPQVGGDRDEAEAPPHDFAAARAERVRREAAWDRACTSVRCSDGALTDVFARACRNLGDLWSGGPEGILHAGAPWFAAPFGRDALIAAWAALPLNPDLAAATLRYLARYQGRVTNPETEEQPGRIMHELRRGDLASAHLVPHRPYFGSVDATPLWAAVLGATSRWRRDRDLVAEMEARLGAALAWCAGLADPDADGLIEYPARRSAWGLINEGWKDSWDGVIRPDGTIPDGPIALVEVQGYHYAALIAAAAMYTVLGRAAAAGAARRAAHALARRFRASFWTGAAHLPAMALDGQKRPVTTVGSNLGHLLATGPLTAAEARAVASRLLQSDFLSGWGIRTLAASEGPYDPKSYHNGSVWPHDTAIATFGLRRSGDGDAAARVADDLLDALCLFPGGWIPELFSGAPRLGHAGPTPYPNACLLQAWASASVYLVLRALLGLWPSGGGLAVLSPRLPYRVEEMWLSGLRFGAARATLRLVRRRDKGRVDCEVVEVDGSGDVRVVAAGA